LQEIEFLYDFASPNSYVALYKLLEIRKKRDGLKIKYTPVFLGGLFKMTNDAPLMKGTLEYNYMAKNLERLSRSLGIEFRFAHERFPVDALRALRGSYFARDQLIEEDYIRTIFRACWGEDRDISDIKILRKIVSGDLGLDFDIFTEHIGKEDTKALLRSDTQTAYDRGVFGAPTFFINGEKYWGTPEVLWYLDTRL
jgi:2-hydroxychromene-2-carboxylate isomerase